MNRGIVFFLGLFVGIMICVLLFYYDVKFFEAKCPPCEKQEVVKHIVTDTVFIENVQKPVKQYQSFQKNDTILETQTVKDDEIIDEESSIYESEFSFEGEQEDVVMLEKLLQTKTVKVTLLYPEKQEEETSDDYFRFFEIQQWSTPIKNRITYQRDQNMVKIKGMEIDKVNVVFWKEKYYLEMDNRYYNIPENTVFEKLTLTTIPQ